MHLSTVLLKENYKLVIAGGSSAGNAIASYFSRQIPSNQIAVIEPNETIYYQPGYTLIAGNLLDANAVVRQRSDFHPKDVRWFKNEVKEFAPKSNSVTLSDGTELGYEFLVIATGLQTRFDLVEGLNEAIKTPGVCSIYDWKLAQKTRDEIQKFEGGNAIFTFPNTPVKCAGAPQKILYLAEEIFRKKGIREKSTVIYNTSLGKIFGVEKYAKVLDKLVEQKGIIVNKRRNLTKIDPLTKKSYFELLDEQPKFEEYEYDLLHVAPPFSPVKSLRDLSASNDPLTDKIGWVDVDSKTLQSKAYQNIFALGDCTNSPNAKTAAAISSQFKVVKKNLTNVMNGKNDFVEYDGYGSCPLIVDSKHVMLAEFNYNGPIETLPFNQAKPSYLSFLMKRYLMAPLYWHLLLRGRWNGPETIRKILHLGFGK